MIRKTKVWQQSESKTGTNELTAANAPRAPSGSLSNNHTLINSPPTSSNCFSIWFFNGSPEPLCSSRSRESITARWRSTANWSCIHFRSVCNYNSHSHTQNKAESATNLRHTRHNKRGQGYPLKKSQRDRRPPKKGGGQYIAKGLQCSWYHSQLDDRLRPSVEFRSNRGSEKRWTHFWRNLGWANL